MAAERRSRVWVDERNEIFRRGLVSCLAAEGFAVVGESADLRPRPDVQEGDVLLFDLDRANLETAGALVRDAGTRLVAMASAPTDETLFEAVESGVAGLLLRSRLTPSDLVNCLRAVLGGSTSVPTDLLARLFGRLARGPAPVAGETLARREVEVLRLLGEGASTREIAGGLCYSEKTVKNIVHDLLVKTNSRSRAQVVALAVRRGVI